MQSVATATSEVDKQCILLSSLCHLLFSFYTAIPISLNLCLVPYKYILYIYCSNKLLSLLSQRCLSHSSLYPQHLAVTGTQQENSEFLEENHFSRHPTNLWELLHARHYNIIFSKLYSRSQYIRPNLLITKSLVYVPMLYKTQLFIYLSFSLPPPSLFLLASMVP